MRFPVALFDLRQLGSMRFPVAFSGLRRLGSIGLPISSPILLALFPVRFPVALFGLRNLGPVVFSISFVHGRYFVPVLGPVPGFLFGDPSPSSS